MKAICGVGICLLVLGCDYSVPLTAVPDAAMDRAVIGLWQRSDAEGRGEKLLVLPMDEKACMVSYPAGSEDAMFGRAVMAKGAGRALIQVEWTGTAKGGVADTNRVFQLAAYEVADGSLTVRLLNGDAVNRDSATPAELAASIEAAKADPKLFDEPMVFRKQRDE